MVKERAGEVLAIAATGLESVQWPGKRVCDGDATAFECPEDWLTEGGRDAGWGWVGAEEVRGWLAQDSCAWDPGLSS